MKKFNRNFRFKEFATLNDDDNANKEEMPVFLELDPEPKFVSRKEYLKMLRIRMDA
jgi:hypothetical protein